jgi:hypothetical protein
MGLYERLLKEAAELPEDPNRERNERMSAYLRNLRGPVHEGGGYVTTEELEQEQERYLTDIRKLRAFLIKGPSGMAGGYWLAHLKRKYPTEYAHLRDIREWYRWHREQRSWGSEDGR